MNFSWLKKFEPKINRNLIFYWILIWAEIAGLFVAYQAGILSIIWHEDLTKLTLVIFIIHILVTIKVGLDTARKNTNWIDPLWLAADQVMAIGILGTFAGFILLMHGAFADGVPTTPAEIQKMLTNMSSGLGTAFWVSASAISSSILQKIKVMNLELSVK